MLRGHIDALTEAGYVEGWAFDTDGMLPALEVEILDSRGERVAHGFACLFRGDLADVEFGFGWCAFRMKLLAPLTEALRESLRLRVVGADEFLHEAQNLPLIEDAVRIYTDVDVAVAEDPSVLHQISELRGCHALFARFIRQRGVSAFVRAAYGYVLGRAADPDGLANYGKLLRSGAITPFGLLSELANSDEFSRRARLLDPPCSPGFAFRC